MQTETAGCSEYMDSAAYIPGISSDSESYPIPAGKTGLDTFLATSTVYNKYYMIAQFLPIAQ
jgi:hypothetical protein